MRDVVVVGGGPVGLAAALHAARAGLSVEVRERRTGTVDKACGEGLMPGAVAALTELGVQLDGHPLQGIRYVDGGAHADARFRRGTGLGVRRTTLHAALREAVDDARVPVVEHPVRSVVDAGDHVLVDGSPASYVVAADGLHSSVRRSLGLTTASRGPRRFGQRAHAEVAPWSDLVEVHWSRDGEAYVTPVGPRCVGVAVLSATRRPLADHLKAYPALLERLGGAPLSPVLGAGPLRHRSRRRVSGRVLLVGDAAGYVDALTGEGIGLGVQQAAAAVDAITAGTPTAYEGEWRRICRRHDLLTGGLVTATRVPLVRRHVVGAAARLPRVFDSAVGLLAGPA